MPRPWRQEYSDLGCSTVSWVLHSAVQFTMQCSSQCSAVYSTLQYSTVQYSTVQYSTVQCSTMYSTVQYSAVTQGAASGSAWPPIIEPTSPTQLYTKCSTGVHHAWSSTAEQYTKCSTGLHHPWHNCSCRAVRCGLLPLGLYSAR